MSERFFEAAVQLPQFLSASLMRVAEGEAARITEIRLRSGRPVLLTLPEGGRYLLPDGALEEREGGRSVRLTHGQLSECFLALCQYSVHSYEREIAEGFFTIGGGHRVGVAGTAVRDAQGGILQIKSPTSLCIRVARTPNGLLPPQLTDLLTEPSLGLLIAGAPGSGKTTVLRACSRALSGLGRRTAVVDERRELWPAGERGFTDLPPDNCDVLSGYPKHLGILQALRSLSPQVILCDEVGGARDAQAVAAGANAGVGLVVTIHGRSMQELRRRPQARALLQTGAFYKVAFLTGESSPGKVAAVRDVDAVF